MDSTLPSLPVLVPLVAAAACLALVRRPALASAAAVAGESAGLAIAGLALARTAGGEVLVHAAGGWSAPFGIVLAIDPLSALLLAVAAAVFAAGLAALLLERADDRRGAALALFFLLRTGVGGALCTGDLFDFYVFFELTALASIALVAHRGEPAQLEAALKFAGLTVISSALLFAGIGAIYLQTGRLTFASLAAAPGPSAPYAVAVALVLVALVLKAAQIPFHFWLPDAHAMAPTWVSMILSGVVVKVGAYGILRLLGAHPPWIWEVFRELLLVLGAGTALLSALAAVGQRDLKRLLAWSTSSQLGYVVAVSALGTVAGVTAALLVIVAHALAKSALFAAAGALLHASGHRRWDRIAASTGRTPWLAAGFLGAGFSLAGIPPLVGFTGKAAVFASLLAEGRLAALAVLAAATVAVLYLVARVFLGLFAGDPHEAPVPGRGSAALVGVLAALGLACGIGSGALDAAARAAAEGLLDGGAYRAAVLGEEAR